MFENIPVIFSYSRAQAIADGELIDVTQAAAREGFRIPVAITRLAYHAGVTEPNAHDNYVVEVGEGFSLAGFLDMIRWHISRHAGTACAKVTFEIGGKENTFVVVCGPGDDPAPVLTIMLPGDE